MQDLLFRQALLSADLLIPDGTGIVIASRMLGGVICKRITGWDVFAGVSELLNRTSGRVFFLGAAEQTLAVIRTKMAQDYPNIQVVGTCSPPFRLKFSESENAAMVEAVNGARPDVLWVGMTAPKQEKWIHQNLSLLDAGFVGAIGAVFDFYTGNIKRSHPVFQRAGLEWLARLVQEPRRLWRRNLLSSPVFLGYVLRSIINKKMHTECSPRYQGYKCIKYPPPTSRNRNL
jgi:N-acetylglucosaminyldiphosphoundecaprenol N-acetyl-beta-D-mannosaminyltransferase